MPTRRIAVCLEVTPKQAVASALDWPGWCRAGRGEQAALETLASYAGRYAPVAKQAGVSFPAMAAFDVIERVPGGSATAFAAPECRRPFPQITAGAELATVTPAAARRIAWHVLEHAWEMQDRAES
jgi:alpha/beta superfamily hydrolase